MPKILFLGTVGTMEAMMKSARPVSSIIIDIDEYKLMINAGPGTFLRLAQEKIDPKDIDALMISSNSDITENDIKIVQSQNNEMKIINTRHNIGNIEIEPVQIKEKKAYIINASKLIIGYMPSANYTHKNLQDFKDTNVLIIECDNMENKHLTEIIGEINPELVLLTSFNLKTITDDTLEYSRQIKKQTIEYLNGQQLKTQIISAKDGMQINTEHYNIRLKQRRLKGFV